MANDDSLIELGDICRGPIDLENTPKDNIVALEMDTHRRRFAKQVAKAHIAREYRMTEIYDGVVVQSVYSPDR